MTPEQRDTSGPECAYAWLTVVVSMLVMAIAIGATYVVVVGLKPIAQDLGWSRSTTSMSYALSQLGFALGGLFMARWADRVGVLPPTLVGAVAVGVGCLLAANSQTAWQFQAVHFLFLGLAGSAATFTPMIANATRWFDRNRGIAVATVVNGQSLAGAVWPPVFRYFVETVGWRDTFLYYGGFAVATMVPLGLLLYRRPPISAEEKAAASVPASKRAMGLPVGVAQMLLGIAIVGCCIAMAMPMVHVVAHGSDLGHPTARAAELLSVLLACGFVSRMVFGLLSDRIGGLRALFIGSGLQASMLSLFTVVESLPALYLTAALFGLAFGGIVPAYAVIVREHFPLRGLGTHIAIVYLFGLGGMSLGGWLGGYIFDLTGAYDNAFLVGVACNVGNLAIIAGLLRRVRHLTPGVAIV